MKKLEIIIQPEKLEDLKTILDGCSANGLMITNIMGYGNQKGHRKIYRGAEYRVNLLPKIKVETIVEPETAEEIIEKSCRRNPDGYIRRRKDICVRSTGRGQDQDRGARTRCSLNYRQE